ncbi:MAG: beta-lactamase family protein [Alphaproteobacteria bacterium]|nr:beta-lactamase family protein [Alphaproteobacteria bacterium]
MIVRLAAALVVLGAVPVLANGLPRADRPESVGLSSDRLKRLTDVMKAGVDKGEIPGAVVLIGRGGKIAYLEAFGFRDREAKAPMTTDVIFRIASMTKPMTSLAALMLAEEGKLHLASPVARYLPEFKDVMVGIEKKDADGKVTIETAAPRRPMTVQDLLRHTSGLTYGNQTSEIRKQYVAAGVMSRDQTNAEMSAKLAKLPLVFQPGTTWEYSMATDVLARVVEVVSGKDFDAFLAERITGRLKMDDSGFWVEAAKQGRLAEAQNGPDGKRPPLPNVTTRPKWYSGGGGMVSTAADYARLCQMFLNGGTLDGARLVSHKTIELMTANHLPPGVSYGPLTAIGFEALAPTPEFGQGFGLGFAVRTEAGRNPLHGSAGDYYWGGAHGTYFWIDPKERMFAILMMQAPAQRLPYRYLMRELVYQAVIASPAGHRRQTASAN